MTASICLLYTVTLSFPGSYHQEICEYVPNHPNHYTNTSLLPSYSVNMTTCTYVVNSQPSSQLLGKSMKLSGRPLYTTLPTYNTQSDVLRITETRTYLTGQKSLIPKSVVPRNSPVPSPSLNRNHVKLVCSSKPTSSNIREGNKTTNQPKTDSSSDAMPNVVKYVTVFSLMAFAGGYSAGYGPGMLLWKQTQVCQYITDIFSK